MSLTLHYKSIDFLQTIDEHLSESQLVNVLPAQAMRFNESILQNYREESLHCDCSELSWVSTITATSARMLSETRSEILISYILVLRLWGYRRLSPVIIFQRLLRRSSASPCKERDYHQWWDSGTMSLTEIYLVHHITKRPWNPEIQRMDEAQDVPRRTVFRIRMMMAMQQLNQKMN